MFVTSIQLDARNRSKAEALERVVEMLGRARGSDLVLLPELWPCGYFAFDRYVSDSEAMDGELVRTLCDQARANRFFLFTGSFVEREGERLFNTSLLVNSDGAVVGRYRKIHLFGHQSRERELLTAGREVAVVETPWGRAGLSTCYDLRFPELYRAMVDRGAEMFLVTAAWPAAREDAWVLFNRARAHENLAYLFSCNFAGEGEGGVALAGRSLFVDPMGVVQADAGKEAGILTREVDMKQVAEARERFPALADRRLGTETRSHEVTKDHEEEKE